MHKSIRESLREQLRQPRACCVIRGPELDPLNSCNKARHASTPASTAWGNTNRFLEHSNQPTWLNWVSSRPVEHLSQIAGGLEPEEVHSWLSSAACTRVRAHTRTHTITHMYAHTHMHKHTHTHCANWVGIRGESLFLTFCCGVVCCVTEMTLLKW